jgi:Fanconi anemia group M protein
MRGVFLSTPSKIGLIELQKKLMGSSANGSKNYNYFFAISACAIAIKLQHALELLETQTLASFNEYLKDLFKQAVEKKSKGIVKLVANPKFSIIYTQSNMLLAKGFEHPKIEELVKIIDFERTKNEKTKVIIFTQFRDTASIISEKLNTIKGVASKVFVGQAKKISRGENTGLNQQEQKKIIREFSSGEINILCATSIAEEGLDIPEVNLVIFYESVPSAIRKIQRGGRTARLISGKLIMLITRGTRDESFYYVANAREKKMHKSIQDIQDDFKNNIHTKTEVQETL